MTAAFHGTIQLWVVDAFLIVSLSTTMDKLSTQNQIKAVITHQKLYTVWFSETPPSRAPFCSSQQEPGQRLCVRPADDWDQFYPTVQGQRNMLSSHTKPKKQPESYLIPFNWELAHFEPWKFDIHSKLNVCWVLFLGVYMFAIPLRRTQLSRSMKSHGSRFHSWALCYCRKKKKKTICWDPFQVCQLPNSTCF